MLFELCQKQGKQVDIKGPFGLNLFFAETENWKHSNKIIFKCMNSTCTVHVFKNIKNGSHGTIYTFKNYFATVFSVFSFNKNKFNPNGSLMSTCFPCFLTQLKQHRDRHEPWAIGVPLTLHSKVIGWKLQSVNCV